MSFALHCISSFLFLFYYECTWWRLFHKHVIRTTLYIFVSIFIFTMSVPDEGYSTNTSFALHCISSFLFLFYYECTWWRLFHKHVIRTTLAICVSIFISLWAYLMKVIPQTCHSHNISYLRFYFYFTMSVPDEGYSPNTSFALHYMSSFLFLFYYERTWWRLFQKHVIRTTLYILVSIFILLWAYLMKVIPQTRHSHYIICLRSYFYFTMSVPDEGYSTNMSFALHYISSFLFLFYYERTCWRLFHKHVIRTTLYIFVSIFTFLWAYLMKVIPQTRHSLYIIYLHFYFYFTMSVPVEGYSTNTSFALHYISSFLFLLFYERTWWRFFHKHVIRTTLYVFVPIFILLWAYLMKVIPQTCHSLYIIYLHFYFYFTMSVPVEGYSTNTSFALHYISSFLFLLFYERTWWRLFHKHVIRFTLYIFISIFILPWAYLIKVIPQTRHLHSIRYLRYYFYFTMSVTDEGYSTNTSFALHCISSFLFLF